jgi:hypothetical protein
MMLSSVRTSLRVFSRKAKYRYRASWSLYSLSTLSSTQFQLEQKRDPIVDLSTFHVSQYIATSAIAPRKPFLEGTRAYAEELVIRIGRTLRYLDRLFCYVLYGTPILILAPATIAFGDYFPALEELVWDYCLWSVVQLGPTFIKLAQWASTRPDLFPPRLVERLQSLQDNVRVKYNFDVVEKTLNEAFGDK